MINLYYGAQKTNTEGTNSSFLCEFNLMPTYDYKAPSLKTARPKDIRQKPPILKYSGSGGGEGTTPSQYPLACWSTRHAHQPLYNSRIKSELVKSIGNGSKSWEIGFRSLFPPQTCALKPTCASGHDCLCKHMYECVCVRECVLTCTHQAWRKNTFRSCHFFK